MKYWLGIIFILIIASCSTAPVNPKPDNKYPVKIYDMTNRTVNNLIVVYFAAGNNLEPNAVVDIAEIESAVSNLRAKGDDVIFYFDAIQNRTTYNDFLTSFSSTIQSNAWYLWPGGAFDPQGLAAGGYLTAQRVYTNKNQNTGDPASLDEFLDFVKSKYSYSKVFLILWNHGNSIFPMGNNISFAKDETPYKGLTPSFYGYDQEADDSMSDEEVCYAISNSLGHVDALAFDACIMGNIEVAYEYKDICDYYIASPNYVPTDGYPYDTWLTTWAQSSSNDINTMSKLLCDEFQTYYIAHNTPYYECLYSMKMPEGADVLAQKMNALAGLIVADTNVNIAWMKAKHWHFNFDNPPSQFYIDYDLVYTYPASMLAMGKIFDFVASKTTNPTADSLAADVSNALISYVYSSTDYSEPGLFLPNTLVGAEWYKARNWYAPANLALLTDYPLIWTVTTGEDYMIDEKTVHMVMDWTNAALLDFTKQTNLVKSMFYIDNPAGSGSFDNFRWLSNSVIIRTNAAHCVDDADHYYKFTVSTGGTFQFWVGMETGYSISDFFMDSTYMISVYNDSRVFVAGVTAGDVKNNTGGTTAGLDIWASYIVKNSSVTNGINANYLTYNMQTTLPAGTYFLKVRMIFTYEKDGYNAPYLMWLGSNNTCVFN
ncbi:MAG: hypothetical protein HPY53_16990 [Brevinematales bacterium]|nr:hypothetical protein [Brevinematales bacterium]